MKSLVFNGWAAGPEAWELCAFPHDWVFSYLEQLDGLPERVMDETDEALLVGFSMGGSSALRMVLRSPGKVRGLVLVSATPRMMEQKDEGWRGMSQRRLDALKLGTQLVFRNDPSPIYREDNLDRGLDYLLKTDLRADLAAFSVRLRDSVNPRPFPVHIFQSERDGVVRPNNADFLKGVFPWAKVTLVPGAEHVLPITASEMIDKAVFDIIAAHEQQIPDDDGRGVDRACAFRRD